LQDARRARIGAIVATRAAAALTLRSFEAWRRAAAMEVVVRMFHRRHLATVELPKALGAWLYYRQLRRTSHQQSMRVSTVKPLSCLS
jgi:hypothetical protein